MALAPTIRAAFVVNQIDEGFKGPTAESGNPIEQAVGTTFKECRSRDGAMAKGFYGEPMCALFFRSGDAPPIPRPLPTSVDELPTLREVCDMAKGKWKDNNCEISL